MPSSPKIILKNIAFNLVISALYIIFAKIGLAFALESPAITIFWPAGGFAFAVVLLGGLKYLPGIFIGGVVAGFMAVDTPWVAIMLGVADTVESYVAYWISTHWLRINIRLETRQDFFKLIFVAGVFASAASAMIGPVALLIGHVIPAELYPAVSLRWWMGDVLGIAFLTPLILVWNTPIQKLSNPQQVLEAIVISVITIMMGQVIFFNWFQTHTYAPAGIAWVIMMIAWSSLRNGRHVTTFLQLIIFSQALWSASHHMGHYAYDMVQSGLFNFWLFGMVSAVGGLTVAVMSDEAAIAHRKLVNAMHYQRALLDNFPFMVWLKDKESCYLTVNKGFAESLGASGHQNLIGKTDFDLYPQDLAEGYRKDDLDVMRMGQQKYIEEEVLDKGTRKWFETYKAPVIDTDGSILGAVGFARDITLRKNMEIDLCIAAIAFESQDGVFVTDVNSIILRVNSAFTKITGYSAEEAIGQSPKFMSSGNHDAAFYRSMWYEINQHGFWSGEIWNRRKNGEVYPEQISITSIKDHQGIVRNYVAIMIDISEAKHSEQQRLAHEVALRSTLVREVHHRIKNSLQGVTGLLRQTIVQHPELKEAVTSVIGQIRSIAVIHGLQGTNLQSKVILQDLISEIAANNKSLWSSPIAVDIQASSPVWKITEEDTVPLALVLNELVLNAIKHSIANSEVSIALHVDTAQNALLTISNVGQLSQNANTPHTPDKGTGLVLLELLLPEHGANLSWEQSGDTVLARLILTAPVITVDSTEIKS